MGEQARAVMAPASRAGCLEATCRMVVDLVGVAGPVANEARSAAARNHRGTVAGVVSRYSASGER